MSDLNRHEKRRLRAHFAFSRMPFSKYMWAKHMFDSACQRELLHGLSMWTEIKGLALVTGASGVGKSISLRRFAHELDDARYRVLDFSYLPSTVHGFLRSLNRNLALPMRAHTTDLFDAVQRHLTTIAAEQGPHPVLLIDDAEGLTVPILDALRRLTCYDLDAEDRFSLLLSGTEDLLTALRHARLEPLRSRIVYAQALRPFALEDTRNYVRHHLQHAGADPSLFSDEAVRRLFQASHGRPRSINQLATHVLIRAVIEGRDALDGDFVARQIAAHPLYKSSHQEDR